MRAAVFLLCGFFLSPGEVGGERRMGQVDVGKAARTRPDERVGTRLGPWEEGRTSGRAKESGGDIVDIKKIVTT